MLIRFTPLYFFSAQPTPGHISRITPKMASSCPGWISKLHAIFKLHYKYHSTEPKQWVHCDFSDLEALLVPEAGQLGPIARAQAVSTPKFWCQPSSSTPDSPFHTINSPTPLPHAHEPRFLGPRGPEYIPYSPWRLRLVDQFCICVESRNLT